MTRQNFWWILNSKIFLETDLLIQLWEQDFFFLEQIFQYQEQDFWFVTKISNTNTEPFLRLDSLILIQQGAFGMCYWKYFLTKFPDTKIETFFRSKVPIPMRRLFSETKYVLILIQSLFRQPNFQIPILIPSKIFEKVSRTWHHTRSKHTPVQRSKENPNDIGYQCDDVDPRANLANGHVHWRCQYCKFVKVFKTTSLLKTWFDLKVDFRSNYCASYLWQSSDPLA